MEAPGCCRRQLPILLLLLLLLLLWVNGLMTLGFTDECLVSALRPVIIRDDKGGVRQQTNLCNESLMLEKLPACGKSFEEMMKKVDSQKWCNLTEFIMYYDNFTQCTEHEANNASCFWPNPLAEGFITGIHKEFFSNCTSEKVHWEDPPDEILITLILIPVMLTCAMITLVVWCSRRSDILVTLETFICEPCDLDRRSPAKELNMDVTKWQLFLEASQNHHYQELEVLSWQRNNLCVQ